MSKGTKKLCPVCNTQVANWNKILGVLPCDPCLARRRKLNKLPDKGLVEMAGESIKHQRKEYAKSIIQPFRSGQLSKEYIDTYGTKGIHATEKEIRKAKNVWTGDVISPNTNLSKSK